jgi:hypothetical protein
MLRYYRVKVIKLNINRTNHKENEEKNFGNWWYRIHRFTHGS